MNVVLIGFRCAGKTSVGKILSERLGRPFIDSDDYIQEKTSLTVRQIFERKGETFFRLLESRVIADLAKLDGTIIATGGGAVLRYKNMQNLKRNSLIILLDVDAPAVHERIQNDPQTLERRPSLTHQDPFEEIVEQLKLRKPYYHSMADHVVPTNGRTIDEVVEEVMKLLLDRGFEEHGTPVEA